MRILRLAEQAKTDPQAFSKLYDHYLPKVFGFVISKVSNVEVAEDLTSEIWLKIVKHITDFEGRSDKQVTAWIFRIARNHIIDYYRTRKETVADDVLEQMESQQPQVSELIDHQIIMQQIVPIIDELPPAEKECIQLRFFADLRNTEIAEVLDMKPKTVSVYIARALKKMRNRVTNVVHS